MVSWFKTNFYFSVICFVLGVTIAIVSKCNAPPVVKEETKTNIGYGGSYFDDDDDQIKLKAEKARKEYHKKLNNEYMLWFCLESF